MPGSDNMSIWIDPVLKSQAEAILSQLGMTMTSAINMFLTQIVRDRAVPLSLSLAPPAALSTKATLQADILRARQARASGYEGRPAESSLEEMDRIIAEAEGNG